MRINAATLAYLAGFLNTVGAALITFNVALTQTQLAAIVGCVNAFFLFVGAAFHASGTSVGPASPPVTTPPAGGGG